MHPRGTAFTENMGLWLSPIPPPALPPSRSPPFCSFMFSAGGSRVLINRDVGSRVKGIVYPKLIFYKFTTHPYVSVGSGDMFNPELTQSNLIISGVS